MTAEAVPDRVLCLGFGEPATRWLQALVDSAAPGGPEFTVRDECLMIRGDMGPALRALSSSSQRWMAGSLCA